MDPRPLPGAPRHRRSGGTVRIASASSFHRHFRAATSMTPVQFQKQIRLQEARTLLMTRSGNVAEIGYFVGYESPSQFSREYRKAFGASPGQGCRAADRSPGLVPGAPPRGGRVRQITHGADGRRPRPPRRGRRSSRCHRPDLRTSAAPCGNRVETGRRGPPVATASGQCRGDSANVHSGVEGGEQRVASSRSSGGRPREASWRRSWSWGSPGSVPAAERTGSPRPGCAVALAWISARCSSVRPANCPSPCSNRGTSRANPPPTWVLRQAFWVSGSLKSITARPEGRGAVST